MLLSTYSWVPLVTLCTVHDLTFTERYELALVPRGDCEWGCLEMRKEAKLCIWVDEI